MDPGEIQRTNRRVYNAMAASWNPLCQPAKDSDLLNPLATIDPGGWLGESIQGQRILCLAAGGGRQSSLYAAAGAEVTVVDLSPAMLELDRRVAEERGIRLRIIEGSMDDLSMLDRGDFDIVIQPVSTCYVRDVQPVFREVARVLRPSGIYVSQHKSPTSLQASIEPSSDGTYRLLHPYYRETPVPAPANQHSSRSARRLRESGAIEFLHRWEQLMGGMCRAGFVIEDFVEPVHASGNAATGEFGHRANYIAPYFRIKARRKLDAPHIEPETKGKLWLPS